MIMVRLKKGESVERGLKRLKKILVANPRVLASAPVPVPRWLRCESSAKRQKSPNRKVGAFYFL